MLSDLLSRYWWMTLLRGLFWIIFGILILSRLGTSVAALTLAFGIIMFIDGIINVINAFSGRTQHDDWWVLLLTGLAGVGLGILTFYHPAATALAIVFYVAIWAVATGLLEIVAAVRLRKQIEGEFWLGLAGVISVVFGVLLVARPIAGMVALAWLVGVYAIAFGVLLVFLALRVKGVAKRVLGVARA